MSIRQCGYDPGKVRVWRRSRGLVAVLITAVIVAGCATVHPTDPYENTAPPVAPAARPTTTVPETSEAPAVSTAGPGLGLVSCIDLALKHNPEVAATTWDREAALAERRERAGERWPKVGLSGGIFHYQDDQRVVAPSRPGGTSYFTDDLASADLVVRLPLYAGGKIVNGIRAAALLAESSEHTLARTRRELVFNVSSVYYGILAQRHVIESLEFSRKVLKDHVDRVRSLMEAEKVAKVDLLRTDVRLADVDQQLLRERNALAVQHRVLANLLGISTEATTNLDVSGTLALPDGATTAGDVTQALARREDYASAKAALEAQARRVDIARGARDPQVSLEASYGGRWGFDGSGDPVTPPASSLSTTAGQPGSTAISHTRPLPNGRALTLTRTAGGATTARVSRAGVDSADDFEDVGRIGITVTIPIFEGGSLRAAVRKEQARLNAARQRLRKLELQIRLDVETASLNVETARQRVDVTHKSIVEAEESLRIEREKYNLGKGTIVDVLDAQSALLTAQTSYYRTLRDYNTALVELRLATGEIQTGDIS